MKSALWNSFVALVYLVGALWWTIVAIPAVCQGMPHVSYHDLRVLAATVTVLAAVALISLRLCLERAFHVAKCCLSVNRSIGNQQRGDDVL